jgi:hypothetical protein
MYPLTRLPHRIQVPLAMSSPDGPDTEELSHLLQGLAAFLDEHRQCGEMDGGADEDYLWMSCSCGAVIGRTLEPTTRRAAR